VRRRRRRRRQKCPRGERQTQQKRRVRACNKILYLFVNKALECCEPDGLLLSKLLASSTEVILSLSRERQISLGHPADTTRPYKITQKHR
jgi:hypothetical protein